jgi:hypothetical protein
MARALGFSRARVSQLVDLLPLAPDIQGEILDLEFPAGVQPINDRDLRYVASVPMWEEQRRRWRTRFACRAGARLW